jgi:hypothetical protein
MRLILEACSRWWPPAALGGLLSHITKSRKAIDRVRAWQLVKSASERADVRVLALRATGYGGVGDPAPVHPHLFRHARVRQIVRHTQSLALAQKQAGGARLHTEYLTLSDDETQRLIRDVPE